MNRLLLQTSWYMEKQPAQFHPATGRLTTTHSAQFTKKMAPTPHPLNGAKRMIYSNNNTTAQVINH